MLKVWYVFLQNILKFAQSSTLAEDIIKLYISYLWAELTARQLLLVKLDQVSIISIPAITRST